MPAVSRPGWWRRGGERGQGRRDATALRRAQGRRSRIRSLAVIAAIAAIAATAAYATDLFRPQELNTVDARFSVRGSQGAPKDVVVVQVDDVTFGELNQRWPFPRSLHARLIDRLREAGVRTIAYDVQFTEETSTREDNALVEAVGRAPGIVLATTEVLRGGGTAVLGGDAVLRRYHARAGNAVINPDPGGVFRRAPYEYDGLKGFAIVAAEQALRRPIPTSQTPPGGKPFWIDYRGPPGTVPAVSFSRVLRGKVPDRVLRGKVVVVGASAPSLNDVHAVSTSGDALMSGPEIQASAIDTALRGFPLRVAPGWVAIALIVLMAAAVPALSLRLSPVPAVAAALVVAAVYLAGAQLAFDSGRIVPVVPPLFALALATVGSLAEQYLVIAFERRRVRDTFARFVPEHVVDDVLACADDDLRLGGERREVTVLFSDLRGFTSFSETREPDRVIGVLNRYLSEMSDAIMEHGGTLISYMGDGIMAVFGAPLEQADHADRALAAAREMLDRRLPAFNEWIRGQGLGEGFRMGVGLNSGTVMTGNVGSQRRMDYTAIGDTTNTASRLQEMTKDTPHQLYVSESTRAALRERAPALEFVDELAVRGRSQPIRVWAPSPPPASSRQVSGGPREVSSN